MINSDVLIKYNKCPGLLSDSDTMKGAIWGYRRGMGMGGKGEAKV